MGKAMIVSFRDNWLGDFYLRDKHSKRVPAALADRLFNRLQLLNVATNDLDLRAPPSTHFEKLARRLEGRHSIRVNDQWRLVFEWNGSRGEAANVYLDNHSYR
jgi:proteic killer suppression protein